VISLGNVTRWLGTQAEALGVEIFPAFRPRRSSTTTTAR
jgi:flavin-dependent dehydrogenase